MRTALILVAVVGAALTAAPVVHAQPAPPAPAPLPTAPKLGGYVQARETAADEVGLTATLNRARFSIDGTLPSKFSYRFLVELEAPATRTTPSTPSLREANLKWSPGAVSITAGQFKTPFSREYLLPIPTLETADFAAVVDSLAPKYDLGVMADYAPRPWLDVEGGVFNGEGQNASTNRDSTVLGVGRLVVRPLAQVGLGGSLVLDSADSLRWGVEGNLEQSGATVRGEYIRREVYGRAAGEQDRGWYVLGLYRIVPNVQLQLRQEDFQRPAYGIGRRVRGTTVGVNLDVVPQRVRILVNGVNKASGPAQRHAHTLIVQGQVRF